MRDPTLIARVSAAMIREGRMPRESDSRSVDFRGPVAVTIIYRNYLDKATLTLKTFARHNPSYRTLCVIVDVHGTDELDGHLYMGLETLLDSSGLVQRLSGLYTLTEAATSVKPQVMQAILDLGGSEALYLDPDLYFVAPLNLPCMKAAMQVTPHILSPYPEDGLEPPVEAILGTGAFNLGFLRANSAAIPWLEWWSEYLLTRSGTNLPAQHFTDQRPVDLAASFSDIEVLKDPGLNVAYWNLHERRVTWLDGEWWAGTSRMTFFHFSGFDDVMLTRHVVKLRNGPAVNPDLRMLMAEYKANLEACGTPGLKLRGLDDVDRLDLPPWIQIGLRTLAQEWMLGSVPREELPLGSRFTSWMFGPCDEKATDLTRISIAAWIGRPDLQQAFPEPLGKSRPDFQRWLETQGQKEAGLDFPVRVPIAGMGSWRESTTDLVPVNVVGFLHGAFGNGVTGRTLADDLERSFEVGRLSLRAPAHMDLRPEETSPLVDAALNIWAVNADSVSAAALDSVMSLTPNAYNVGVWWVETTQPRREWRRAADRFDEIWAQSEFVYQVLRESLGDQVQRSPLSLPSCRRSSSLEPLTELPLSDSDFVVLLRFDFNSSFARKNPLDAVQAFKAAFPVGHDVVGGRHPKLVIKSMGGASFPVASRKLLRALANDQRIVWIDRTWSREKNHALTSRCDVFLTLHRSEGLGLNMYEAMAMGKPVVATKYSGGEEFLSQECAVPISSRLVPIAQAYPHYDQDDGLWAAPDVREASEALWRLYSDPDWRQKLGAEAARRSAELREDHRTAMATFVEWRLSQLREAGGPRWRSLRDRSEQEMGHVPDMGSYSRSSRRVRRVLRSLWSGA